MPSIFTKILNQEIPGEIIFQDGHSFVILTIEPMTPGHMMVVPKQEVDHLWDLDGATYHHLFDIAKQMQIKLKAAYPHYPRVGLVVEGFGVPHAHIHIFGYEKPLEPTMLQHIAEKQIKPTATPDELHAVAEKLRAV
jgi:diadenosine tetraphosphate (Ap4A) HIT family hydrolase